MNIRRCPECGHIMYKNFDEYYCKNFNCIFSMYGLSEQEYKEEKENSKIKIIRVLHKRPVTKNI